MSRIKKALAYVLGDSGEKENHLLPINAMQYSQTRGELYTAGRDGIVKVWKSSQQTPALDFDFSVAETDDAPQDLAETVLKLETCLSSAPLDYSVPSSKYDSLSSQNYNVHFDWINDLKLVNENRHLVTASADLTMKLINLDGDDSNVQRFENLHTDYIKKVSSIPLQNALVSGGLDGKVVVWDLASLKPLLQFTQISAGLNLPSSIYSLANDNCNLICTGGPNNTVNLYDRRTIGSSSCLIRKLVGHQDNVRCLLMNSNYILSGSSDTTIKLWDIRNFNVYKTFEAHDDAVWSLCTSVSSDPGSLSAPLADFRVFYSGDKAGNLIKTDLNYLSTQSEPLNTCAPTFSSSDMAFIDEQIGLCTLVAKSDSPLISVCAEGSLSLFASTYTSLNRYYIPDTQKLAKYQYLRSCMDYADNLDRRLDENIAKGIDSAADQSDLDSDFYDIVSHLSMDSGAFDHPSSLSGVSLAHPTSLHDKEGSNVEHTSMFLNVNGGPSLEYVNAYKDEIAPSDMALIEKNIVDQTPVEMLLYPPKQIITTPFNRRPLQEFPISPKSIVHKKGFNNKRHILTLYLNGEIKIWDVFICQEIKSYPYKTHDRPLTEEELKFRTKEMDEIFKLHQTVEVLNYWCEIHIKSGKLFVIVAESFFNNVEIFYDELIANYPFLAMKVTAKGVTVIEDSRFWLSKIFINSLFQSYAKFEGLADEKLRESLRSSNAKPRISLPNDQSLDVDDGSKRKRLFSRKSSKLTIPQSASVNSTDTNETSPELALLDESVNVIPEDTVLKMLVFNKRFYREKYNNHGVKKITNSLLKIYSNNSIPIEEDEEYRPLIPIEQFPSDLLVIMVETSPDLGNYRDLCSFKLHDLAALSDYTTAVSSQLIVQLRTTLPKWIGAPILYNRFPAKEAPKIAFQLVEIDYELLSPTQKIGGKTQKKIKKLPMLGTSIKLTSHSMLRVSKILQYLTEKFETRTSEMKMKKQPSEWLALECRGQELDYRMTLQTIKTTIWKSGTDIELRFRRRFDDA